MALQFENLVIPDLGDLIETSLETVRVKLNLSREEFTNLLRKEGDSIFKILDDTLTDTVLSKVTENYLDEQNEKYISIRNKMLADYREMFHPYFLFVHSAYNVWSVIRKEVNGKHLDVADYTLIGFLFTLCDMADEIGQALAGGSVRAALTLWRSFYEHAVTGIFLLEKDSAELFKRFADFSHRDVKKQSESYENHHQTLKFPALTDEMAKAITDQTENLKKQHGNDFLDDYAWAKTALGEKTANFHKIETTAGMSRYRPFYIWASNYIHPNFRTATNMKQTIDKESLIDPMQLTMFTFKLFLDRFLFRFSINHQYGTNILVFWKIIERLKKSFDS
jgi:hypothetical protein